MWQDRLCKILDEKSINKLKNSTVLIIGLGGVGGSALESVVRMGIGNIVVVDNASNNGSIEKVEKICNQ